MTGGFSPGLGVSAEALQRIATGRSESLFRDDWDAASAALADAIGRRRILVIGGAGTIGSQVVRRLVPFRPKSLHVLDTDENGLAELVRAVRSAPGGLPIEDFRTLPLDFGSPLAARFVMECGPYDAVLNFAALKHVRSEKDRYSLLQMLDVNVLKNARLMRTLGRAQFRGRLFVVSTDKAANPVSAMGASKRIMEEVLFRAGAQGEGAPTPTSARFGNIAFSNGSLLQSFCHRVASGQPIAVPEGVRRYFLSMEEGAHIAILAAFMGPPGTVLVPDVSLGLELKELRDVAVGVLRLGGLEPAFCTDEEAARDAVTAARTSGRWPVLVTPLDTSGEKPFEEFVAEGEHFVDTPFRALRAIVHPAPLDGAALERFLAALEAEISQGGDGGRAALLRRMAELLPGFEHRETGLFLDQRM